MKIISIGTDRNIFDQNSPVRGRIAGYGTIFDELHIVIFSKKHLNLKEQKIADNVWIYPTNSNSKVGYIFDAIKLGKKIFTKMQGDVRAGDKKSIVITAQDPFECGFVGWRLKRALRLPLQIQVHVDFFNKYYKKESLQCRIQTWIAPFILRRADGIRVVSQKIRQYLSGSLNLPADKITVLPVYISMEVLKNTEPKFNIHDKYPQFKTVFLIASRLIKLKNIPLAIKSLSKIHENFKNISDFKDVGLVIVGSGKEKNQLEALVAKLNLSNYVVFESWTNDLPSYMKTADIFLLPSNYEGWGMTVVEAAACGLPSIMTNAGCANEFMINGKNAVVVPVDDIESFKNAMEKLILDSEFRIKLGKAALESTKNLISKEDYLNEYKKSFNIKI